MTRDEAAKLLPIIQAFAEGKRVESRASDDSPWITMNNPSFDFLPAQYRIKPEPLIVEGWFRVWNESESHMVVGPFKSRESALDIASPHNLSGVIYIKQEAERLT